MFSSDENRPPYKSENPLMYGSIKYSQRVTFHSGVLVERVWR